MEREINKRLSIKIRDFTPQFSTILNQMSTSPSNSLTHSTFTPLKLKNLKNIPHPITCYALNYLTHRVLLCTKEKVYLYDMLGTHIIRRKNYAKELSKLYEVDVEIKSADAMLMANLWITLINKKSFLFFNDYLEITRIYTESPSPLFNVQVIQRTNDFLTIREDRKAIKFWKFELTDDVLPEKKGFDLHKDREGNNEKDSANNYRERFSSTIDREKYAEKEKQLKELGSTFEINIIAKRQINIPSNRFIIKLTFSEELRLLIVTTDNSEILLYNLFTGEPLQPLNFCTNPHEREAIVTPHVTIDQEILYYCDEKRIASYDLSTKEELFNVPHNLQSRIAYLHAERSSNNTGIYILTVDEKLHVYSQALKKSIWTFDMKYLESSSAGTLQRSGSSRFLKKNNSLGLSENKMSSDPHETLKKDNAMKEMISKLKLHISTDLGTNGLVTLIISKPGMFMAFDVMSACKMLYTSPIPMIKMEPTIPEETPSSPSKRNIPQESDLFVRLELKNNTVSEQCLTNSDYDTKSPFDLIALWRQGLNEPSSPSSRLSDEISAGAIREMHILHEEKMYVILTKTSLYAVSWRCNRTISQQLTTSEVVSCIAINLNDDNPRFGNYYIILGTKKGAIIIVEADFGLRTLNILKHMPKHDSVLTMKHLTDFNSLLSVGVEGDIFLYSITKHEDPVRNSTNFFPTQQIHRLIWNSVTTAQFFSDNEIIAGLDNGVIQYAKFSWKNETNLESKLYEFHASPVRLITLFKDSPRHFAACDDDSVVSFWNLGETTPLRVFRFSNPIISLFINKPINEEEHMDIYIASTKEIVKFDYDYGGIVVNVGKDYDVDWDEAIYSRSRNNVRTLRDYTDLDNVLSKMENHLHTFKKANKDSLILGGPMMSRIYYDNPRYYSIRTLEADFFQYSFKDHPKITKKGEFLVLDPILNGFHEKKVKGESLTQTSNTKSSKKLKGTGSWQDLLGKTLHRYPYIKSCMAEKAKAKELQDMHRNIIQLLNATYTGEDNLQKILDFLETQCKIKRSDIDEASLIRAKQLYFKKAPAPSTHRSNSPLPIPDEIILSRVPSRDNLIPVANGKVRLPALSLEKAKRNPSRSPLQTDEISTAKSTGKPKVLTARHFKNNSESFARKTSTNILNSPSPFMSPGSTFSNYGKSPTRTARVNEAGGFFITKQRDPGALLTARETSSYQPYSTSGFGFNANTPLKLDSKFSFSPSPTIPSVLSALNTARPGLGEDKLSIGQDENTIRSPFFVTTRSELNRDAFLAEVFPKKIYQGPSISSLFNSSNAYDSIKKPTKNFVALHSKGFQTSENVDLFNHVLRLLLKNHHILKADLLSDKPKVTKQSSSNSGSNDDDEDSVEYVPIEIKQFVLETSQKELEALDSVILMYEKHTGSRINTNESHPKSPEEGYNINKLEEEMSKENEYLEQVLKRINDHGVESVSLNQMIKFKQIMKRRFEIFTRLQTHIEVSGLLRTKPLTSREVQLKEELKQTFRQIKKITALKPIFAFYEPRIKSTSQSGGSSPHKNPGSQSARTPNHARHDSFAHASDNMLNSIRRSIETTKTLDRVVKAFRNDYGPGSPIQESLAEAEGGRKSKAKGKKVPKKTRSYNSLTPHGDSAIKTWGDVIGFESNMSLGGADFGGGPSGPDFERKSTLASIVYEAKKKRRTSFTETKEDNKERQRHLLSRGEAKTVNVLTEGERKRRLEKLLAKPGGSVALPLETEEDDEEIKEDRNRRRMEIKEIERAWREKDFEFLRTYLKAPTIKVSAQKETDEDEDSKMEKRIGNYERKKSKKKKKVNPNIRTNSGGVTMLMNKGLRKSDSNSRDLADDLSDEQAEKSEEESDDLIVEEDDDEDLFSPFFKRKEIKSPSLMKDKPEFHIDINATKGKSTLSLTNRRSESRIMTKPSPRISATGVSEKIKIIAELKKQANAKITRKFAPSKKAATHETKISLDKPLTPKGKRQSTRSDLGASIQGDSMGFSVWQKAENTLDRLKNDTISIESKYGLENQQILEQTLEDKDKDKNKKLKEIVEDWKFIQDFKPPPLNLKRGSLKNPTIKKEDGTNSEIGSATPVPRNFLMSPGNGKRASMFVGGDSSRPKTDDKMTIKSFPSKNDNGEDGTSSRLKTEEQKKELNISGLGKWSEGNRSPLNESKITEKSLKNISMNKSIEKSLVANMPSPVHSPVSRIEDKSTESSKKGNTKTKIEKESPKQKTGKSDKNDKDKKKAESGEQENEGKGKSKAKEGEKAKEPEKKLLDIKKMNTQSVIAEEPELKLEEQKSVLEVVVVKTNASVSRAEITSPMASPRVSVSKILQESILLAKSPRHDRSPPILEEENIQSVEEVESPATASIGKVLEELPSPLKKPKRVKVIKKSELPPPEPEPEIVLSKKRLTRTSVRSDLENKKAEDLLDDPIALLNSVLKVHEVDHETKLDLFLYGNRKEALKDFVKEIEETIEHNVLKQEECGEQLDDFFDKRLNNMLTENSSSLFPKQNAANFDAHHLWKRSSTRLIKLEEDDGQNTGGNPYLRKAFREYEDERLRRQAFLHGPIIVNHLKTTDQRKVKVLQQGCMGVAEKDIRNGKVILSPDCLEIMLQNKGETLLGGAEDNEDDECEEYRKERRMQEKEEMELLGRIERIRRFLRELKKRDPPHFRELVQSFYQNKKFYDFVMRDIEAKKEDRVLEPLNNDDDTY